jgi:hypothetical protein
MPGEETLDLNDALSSIRGFASSWSATTGGSALVDCPVDYAEDDRLAEQ